MADKHYGSDWKNLGIIQGLEFVEYGGLLHVYGHPCRCATFNYLQAEAAAKMFKDFAERMRRR